MKDPCTIGKRQKGAVMTLDENTQQQVLAWIKAWIGEQSIAKRSFYNPAAALLDNMLQFLPPSERETLMSVLEYDMWCAR